MDDTVIFTRPIEPVEEIQKGWHELKLRVDQLEAENEALDNEIKSLRFLTERVIEHRQKSHSELVILLTSLVTKLPINDVGVVISKLVEHNTAVSEMCAALVKGKADTAMAQPALLKALDQTKQELANLIKLAVEELIHLDPPLEHGLLRGVVLKPELFFTPAVVRASRCYVKGQLPRERILKSFGEEALVFFNDMTTDAKRNPRPKVEEIVLSFKNDFEALFHHNPVLSEDKRGALQALHQQVQRSKAATEEARAQKNLFYKLSFALELLHYYENQSTEAPDVIFASRLPVLIEQLALGGTEDRLDEKLIRQAETLLAHIINPDHRLMVVNNVGKAGETGRTLKYVLRFRVEENAATNPTVLSEVIPEFIKHLIPPQKPPAAPALAALLRMIPPDLQRLIVRSIMVSDRLRKESAEQLGRALGQELGLVGLEMELKVSAAASLESERQIAWQKIKNLISSRSEPSEIAAAIRDRLHARYDAEEAKQSWMTLAEAEPISLIRVFCHLPYLADGRTDPVARAVMETYVTRLTHEKYAATYGKVLNSLKNMFKANAQSPTLLNFVALVKWVDAGAAQKISSDLGMVV